MVHLAAAGLAGRSLLMKAETQAVCGLSLDSLSSINKLTADKDCVFVLVPGESEEKTREAARHIDEAIEKISARGVQAGTFTLEKDGADYADMLKMLSVQSLPGVLVIGKGCGSTLVSDGVTEEKLLGAYVLVSMPPAACGTACGP